MPLTVQEQKLVDMLDAQIYPLQRLFVREIGRVNPADTKEIFLTYQNQRLEPAYPVTVRKRSGTWSTVTSGTGATQFVINADLGKITLGTPLSVGDEVAVEYTFRYFSDNELKTFLNFGLDLANAYKPTTAFTLESMPLEWNTFVVLWAQKFCLERILADQGVWARGLIFKEPDKYFNYLNNVLTELRSKLELFLKHYKARRSIRIYGISSGKFMTQSIVTELNFRNFTLLGGS